MISISSERFIILTMLEQGKITCEEAEKLLKAIGHTSENNKNNLESETTVSETIERTLNGLNAKIESISKNLSQKFDTTANNLKGKEDINTGSISEKLKIIEDEYKEKLEAVLLNISKNKDGISSMLSDKTRVLQDSKGSDKFNNSIDNLEAYFKNFKVNIPELGTRMTDILSGINIKRDSTANTFCNVYKRRLTKNENVNLVFENMNGSITIDGKDDDNIEIKVYTRSSHKNLREIFTLINEKDTYGIKGADYLNAHVSVEANVPAKKISYLRLSSSSGKISISDIDCNGISIASNDSRIYLSGVCSKLFQVGTENSKIEVSDGAFGKIAVNSFNTQILMYNLNCNDLAVNTSNSRIFIELSEDYKGIGAMDVCNKNARIDIDLTLCIDMGVGIEAVNIDGSMDIGVPGIIYSGSENFKAGESTILCETPDYSTSDNRIKIKAVTSGELISIK